MQVVGGVKGKESALKTKIYITLKIGLIFRMCFLLHMLQKTVLLQRMPVS